MRIFIAWILRIKMVWLMDSDGKFHLRVRRRAKIAGELDYAMYYGHPVTLIEYGGTGGYWSIIKKWGPA
jgi:hypothetical protein